MVSPLTNPSLFSGTTKLRQVSDWVIRWAWWCCCRPDALCPQRRPEGGWRAHAGVVRISSFPSWGSTAGCPPGWGRLDPGWQLLLETLLNIWIYIIKSSLGGWSSYIDSTLKTVTKLKCCSRLLRVNGHLRLAQKQKYKRLLSGTKAGWGFYG